MPTPSPPVSLLEIGRVLEETARLVRQYAGAVLKAPQQQWLTREELSAGAPQGRNSASGLLQ